MKYNTFTIDDEVIDKDLDKEYKKIFFVMNKHAWLQPHALLQAVKGPWKRPEGPHKAFCRSEKIGHNTSSSASKNKFHPKNK